MHSALYYLIAIVSLYSIFLCGQTGFAITLTHSLFFSTQKNTIQAFMGVSLISISVAVDVKMFFLRYQRSFNSTTKFMRSRVLSRD